MCNDNKVESNQHGAKSRSIMWYKNARFLMMYD